MKISGNLDTREGADALPIIQSMIPWTEKIYDMSPDEVNQYKNAFEEEYHNNENIKDMREVIDCFYIEYQYFQVRKTYEWVLEEFRLSGDKLAVRREILLQRLRGSTQSPFDPADLEYLIQHMVKSTRDLVIQGKWLYKLYDHGAGYTGALPRDFDPKIPYLVGIDPAAGGAGDNFSVTIVNPYNLLVAAEFKSPYIGGPSAVRMIIELVRNHIPNCVLIPEKNSMGCYLIQMLLETEVRNNLYWSESARQLEEMTEEDGDAELRSQALAYKKYGHWTGRNRKAMFEILFNHIRECRQIMTSEYLIDDMCKLVKTSTGRIEAAKKEHDDCVMSYLIAMYVYYTGDNLGTFGITRTEHPQWGPLELDEERDPTDVPLQITPSSLLKEERKDFDEMVMDELARQEGEIQMLTSRFSFVRDDVYSKMKASSYENQYDGTVSIPPTFFDQMNGF